VILSQEIGHTKINQLRDTKTQMETLNRPAKILIASILVPSAAVVGIFVYCIGMGAIIAVTAPPTTDTTTTINVRDTPEYKANVKKLRDVLRNNNVTVPSGLYNY
jgi:hypothetical protein